MKTSFEKQVIATVQALRDLIALDDKAPTYFNFRVEANGRVRDGDVTITFQLGESDYTNTVKGDNVEAVIAEYLRRIGWQKAHQYLSLPKVSEPADAS